MMLPRIVRLAYQMAWDLAGSDIQPDFTGANQGSSLPQATGLGR